MYGLKQSLLHKGLAEKMFNLEAKKNFFKKIMLDQNLPISDISHLRAIMGISGFSAHI